MRGVGKESCVKGRDSLRINRRLTAAVPVSYDFEPVAFPEGEIVVHSGGVVVQRPHYQCGCNQKQSVKTSLKRHPFLTV